MKVVIYARVSTDDKEQNPERQILKCKQYCELHNHEVQAIYQEHISGDTDPFKRPEAGKMLSSKPDAIVIYSMDRLTRQHPIKVINLINRLKDSGIKVISITEPAFNMENELSEVMLFLIGWFNNYFLTKLRENVKSGLDRAKAHGKKLGRPKTKINEYRAYQLLFVEKRSLSDVSKQMGVSKSKLFRFKKVVEKNHNLFINKLDNPKTSVFETKGEEDH